MDKPRQAFVNDLWALLKKYDIEDMAGFYGEDIRVYTKDESLHLDIYQANARGVYASQFCGDNKVKDFHAGNIDEVNRHLII